jgi:hypothetical protein
MKKIIFIWATILLAIVIAQPVFAADKNEREYAPWDKFEVSLGWFLNDFNTELRVDSESLGLGTIIDVEEVLDLDEEISVWRVDGQYRFSHNGRHKIDFMLYDLSRDATRTLSRDIQFEDRVFTVGTTVDTTFNLQILKAAYAYSLMLNETFDISVSAGIHFQDIKFQLEDIGKGIEEELDLIAPLPVIGLRADIALTEKLYLKESLDLFYLKYEDFRGRLIDFNLALEYKIRDQVGVGLGWESNRIEVEAEDEDAPLDIIGKLDFWYSGVWLYTTVYF